ncbi:MAG TPA: hypothetical protein PKE04_21285, partial [Clostridia bacterium]|nr:hypothetical protein [Clostridia bacterium]
MQAWIAVVVLLALVLALMFSRRRQPLPALRDAALAEDALCMHVKTKAAGYDARGFARMSTIRRAVRDLREAYRYCASLQNTLSLTPASQWLCDNVRMLEEAAVSVNDALRHGPRLPASNSVTQVAALAREIIAHSDAHIDKDLLIACAFAWQQAQPLTEAELWALPLALRRGLVLLA